MLPDSAGGLLRPMPGGCAWWATGIHIRKESLGFLVPLSQASDTYAKALPLPACHHRGQTRSSRRYRRLVVSARSEEHTSELQSLMRISYDAFLLKKRIIHMRMY